MIARRRHHVAGTQNADQFIHVVLVGGEDRHAAEFFRDTIGRTRIQAFGRGQNNEDVALLAERLDRIGDRGQVMLISAIGRGP